MTISRLRLAVVLTLAVTSGFVINERFGVLKLRQEHHPSVEELMNDTQYACVFGVEYFTDHDGYIAVHCKGGHKRYFIYDRDKFDDGVPS